MLTLGQLKKKKKKKPGRVERDGAVDQLEGSGLKEGGGNASRRHGDEEMGELRQSPPSSTAHHVVYFHSR